MYILEQFFLLDIKAFNFVSNTANEIKIFENKYNKNRSEMSGIHNV